MVETETEEEYNEEEGMEDFDEPEPVKKPVVKAKKEHPLAAEKREVGAKPIKKFEAFHQPEVLGIRNNVTGEVIQGFTDLGSCVAIAELLNKVDYLEDNLGSFK